MKKVLLFVLGFALTLNVSAQIKTPQPSPFSKLEQKVGLTDVTIEYSRPGIKGRAIFGDLVPYETLWRTGANENTKVTFSDPVTIDGQELKPGTYAIYTKPGTESWEVIFYSDAGNWGTPREWDDAKVAAKTTVEVYKLPVNIETFTITLDDLTNSKATIGLMWENVYVGVPFTVPTDKAVVASIKNAMNGPGANEYYAAAAYYFEENKNIEDATKWIDKAVELTKDKPRFWFLRKQSLIHAKAGDKKGAIEAAKKSLKGAEEAGNADYVKMNTESLKAWGAI